MAILSTSSLAPGGLFNLAQHFLIATPDMDDPRFRAAVIYLWEHTPRGTAGICINKPGTLTLARLMEQIPLALQRPDLLHTAVGWGGPVMVDRGLVLHSALWAGEGQTSGAQGAEEDAASAPHTPAADDAAVQDSPATAPPATPADSPRPHTETTTSAHAPKAAQPATPRYQTSLPLPDGLQLTTSRDLLSDLAAGGGPARLLPVLGHASWGAEQLAQEVRDGYWLTVAADHDVIFNTPPYRRYERACALLGIHDVARLAGSGRA